MAQSLGRPLLSAVRLPSFERRCFTQLAARRAATRERGPEFPGPRPEPSVRIASKELMDKIPDLGLLDATFVPPTGKNLPSFFHAPGALLKLQWTRLKLRLRDYLSLVVWKITSPMGAHWYNRSIKIYRGRIAPTAIALHREMYSAFAESDIPTLQKICADGILDSFRARIGNRAHGEKMLWELIRYNKRAKIVSHRAARLPIEGAGLRQAVVRIASRQKLSRYTANGALVKGTGKERDVVEYVVLEKKCWQGKEEDWRIWGTMEETKFETVMQWQRDALGA